MDVKTQVMTFSSILIIVEKAVVEILFGIEDDAVVIYHIRHTSQQWMTREEF